MAEAAVSDKLVFKPHGGGDGVALSVSTSSSRAKIPGADPEDDRVLITNHGASVCFVRIGQDSVVATTASMAILTNSAYLIRLPDTSPSPPYIAAICGSGDSTTLNVVRGRGV